MLVKKIGKLIGILDSKMSENKSYMDIKSGNNACNNDINSLKRINIDELRPNMIHYNCVLYGKIITEMDKIMCISFIISDDNENICKVSIYNLVPFSVTLIELEQTGFLKKNSVVAIKEPYFKYYGNGNYGIRIDNPHYNFIVCSRENNRICIKFNEYRIKYVNSLKLNCIQWLPCL